MWGAVRHMIAFRVPMSAELLIGMAVAIVMGAFALAYLLVLVVGP